VNVDAVRQPRLCLAAGLPAPALPAVASSIHWNHIQKEQVSGLRVQSGDRHSASREHTPAQGTGREAWSRALHQEGVPQKLQGRQNQTPEGKI
jgi:hypothetical protein